MVSSDLIMNYDDEYEYEYEYSYSDQSSDIISPRNQ